MTGEGAPDRAPDCDVSTAPAPPGAFARLLKRADFVAARRGERIRLKAATIQRLSRDDGGPARFGLTATKKIARSAVQRNRMRRRLREALRLGAAAAAAPGCDHVILASIEALNAPFAALQAELTEAMARPPRRRKQDAGPPGGPTGPTPRKRGRSGARAPDAGQPGAGAPLPPQNDREETDP